MSPKPAQQRLSEAMTRLLAGQSGVTDGELTVANLCREAGAGRDSYYRSPQDFKDAFQAAQANASAQRPELARLREEIATLKQERTLAARTQADALRDLETTVRRYANQIQVLALARAELAEENRQLRDRLNALEEGVVTLTTQSE